MYVQIAIKDVEKKKIVLTQLPLVAITIIINLKLDARNKMVKKLVLILLVHINIQKTAK